MLRMVYIQILLLLHIQTLNLYIDFVRLMPGVPKAKVKSRLILTPQHAKRLLKALGENISKYESLMGISKTPENRKLYQSISEDQLHRLK